MDALCQSALSEMVPKIYLNCLIFERTFGIGNVFKGYTVKLALVYVSYAVVFSPLGSRDGRLQKVAKTVLVQPKHLSSVTTQLSTVN